MKIVEMLEKKFPGIKVLYVHPHPDELSSDTEDKIAKVILGAKEVDIAKAFSN